MNRGLSDKLRCLILSSAATGLLLPSSVVLGQSTNAVSSNKKKPAGAQVVEPPRLLSVPDSTGPAAQTIRPVGNMEVAAADKSDVQRELEALYQQDGREMPALNMQPLTPITPQGQQSDTTNNPAAQRPAQPKPTTTQKPAKTYQGSSSQPGANVYTPQAPYVRTTPAQPSAQAAPPVQRYSGLFNDASPATGNQPPAVNQPQTQQTQNSKFGFFKRMTASSSKPAYNPNPVPPDFRDTPNPVPATPPATAATGPSKFPGPNGMKYYSPNNQKPQTTPPSQPVLNAVNSNAAPHATGAEAQLQVTNLYTNLPEPSLAMPPLYLQPLPLPVITPRPRMTGEPTALPPLLTEAQTPLHAQTPIAAVAISSLPEPTVAKAPEPTVSKVDDGSAKVAAATITETATDFPNPFPEASENDIDGRGFKMPKRREITSKPYTEEEKPNTVAVKPAIPEPATEPATEPAAKPEEDPFAVAAKNFAEPTTNAKTPAKASQNDQMEFLPPVTSKPQESEAPAASANPPIAAAPAANGKAPDFDAAKILGIPPIEPGKPVGSSSGLAEGSDTLKLDPPNQDEEQQLEKMRKIRERFGMKGLKGFCPVTLHDERDLVDAKPEFHSTHRSQKFHFASAEARDKFEADPVKYAPAAYGADVVALSRDRDVVEGTLDYAAWFKGRLYLFGTQENYDVFVENPSKYATLNGIE